MTDLIRSTESLCPVCLSRVPAELIADRADVALHGHCPEHGAWRTVVWSGPPSFGSWCEQVPEPPATGYGVDAGDQGPPPTDCPGTCGLCARHRQKTCTAVLEVTQDCDVGCPVCFAESSPGAGEAARRGSIAGTLRGGNGSAPPGGFEDEGGFEGHGGAEAGGAGEAARLGDPPLEQIAQSLRELFAAQGPVNLQLSGGEPTVRTDLADIIRSACNTGFTFVQLNTNGLRLAREPGYAERLRDAGLASVFLQFDGLSDDTHRTLRGRPLAAAKMRALERCAEAGLAVVLVPTVVPGVNDYELGDLVRLATRWAGVVRGVHMQPVSYFGRYVAGDRLRLTLPEVLHLLERQTYGEIQVGDFAPSCCEHVRCSFRARYWVREGGRLEPLRSQRSCCPPGQGDAARRAVAATSRQWSRRPRPEDAASPDSEDGLGRFLEETGKILAISGMLFQDAWNLDLERVRQCCVHVVVPGRGLVPFCLWNLTSTSGRRLYPRR